MSSHLIIDGNAVYEVDEDCMRGMYRGGDWWRGNQMRTNRRRGTCSKEGKKANWGCCEKE